MRICRAMLFICVWGAPAVSAVQDQPPGRSAADLPLPPGAIMRLGETRFRPGARITHLAFSPDGKQLVSWGGRERLSIWEVPTGKELRSVVIGSRQLAALTWGPDGRGFAVMAGNHGAEGKEMFRIWSFADLADKPPPGLSSIIFGKIQGPGPQPPDDPEVYQLFALSSDGEALAAVRAGGGAATGAIDLFEAKACDSGAKLKRLATRVGLPPGKCYGLQFTRGNQAVVALLAPEKGGQAVVMWDIAKGTLSEPFTVPVGIRQGERQSFDVADDGSAVVVGYEDGTIKIFGLPGGKERLSVKKHDGPKYQPVGRGKWSEVSAVKFVNGGRQVLSAGRDDRQLVWDAKTGVELAVLNGHFSWVEAVALSPDGKCVATAGQDSLIRLWDTHTWKPIQAPQGPYATIWRLEVSRDGKHAAAGSGDNTARVWEIATGREVRTVTTFGRSATALFTPAGDVLTENADEDLDLYPIPNGPPKRLTAKGHLLDFTPDGKALLTAQGSTVHVWTWPACTQRKTILTKGKPRSAAIAPDNKTAVIGLEGAGGTALIELTSGAIIDIDQVPFKLHWFAREAGFSPDGRTVFTNPGISGQAQAEAWNVANSELVRKFATPPVTKSQTGGMFYLLSFAVSADGRRAVSCDSLAGVTVFETATGQVLAHFSGHREGVVAIAFTPDGNRVLSAGGDHQVLVWDVSLAKLAGKVEPLKAAHRDKAWEALTVSSVQGALPTMAAFAADPDAAVAFLATKLRPAAAVDPALLDRIFRNLDSENFVVRDKADRELNALGSGAIAGVRARAAKASIETRRRAEKFLSRYESEDGTADRIRLARALDILAEVNTPAARKLIEELAGGATDVWATEASRRMLSWMAAADRRPIE